MSWRRASSVRISFLARTSAVLGLAVSGLVGVLAGCAEPEPRKSPLVDVRSYAVVGAAAPIESLVASRYDALVFANQLLFAPATLLQLHSSAGAGGRQKLVLDSVDVRYDPSSPDPRRRQDVFAFLDRIIDLGFDGALLRGVEGPPNEHLGDARAEAIAFVQSVAQHARAKRRNFAIVVLDACDLITEPTFAESVDGIAQQGLWFVSASPTADIRQAPSYRTILFPALRGAISAGFPVFTLDLASDPEHAAEVYSAAHAEHFIAYVTNRPDDGLTKTPPAGL